MIEDKTKMDALSKLISTAKEVSIEAEISDDEGDSMDTCKCGADLKCPDCGKAPSMCSC